MDSDLVIRAQRGDQRAFEMLALKSHPRLQRVAVGILRDPHLAEDAVQHALLNIWTDLRRLREPDRFEAWSYRLLVRACYAEARRRQDWLPDIGMRPGESPLAADPCGAVVEREQLERAFARMSVDHRAVVVLHYLVDLTLDQVADTLGLPAGTVASRMNRALQALRAALEADARPAASQTVRPEVAR